MDCGAATADPSDDAPLSQVNKWCQTDMVMSNLLGWRYMPGAMFNCAVCLGCIKWRGGFE